MLNLGQMKKHMQTIINNIDFGDVFPLSNHDFIFFTNWYISFP